MVNFLVGIGVDILDYFVKILWLTGMFPLWLDNILWLAKVRNSLQNCHQLQYPQFLGVFFCLKT